MPPKRLKPRDVSRPQRSAREGVRLQPKRHGRVRCRPHSRFACETLAAFWCAETTNTHKTCGTPRVLRGNALTIPRLHFPPPNSRLPAPIAAQGQSAASARPRSTHRFLHGSPTPKVGRESHESDRKSVV